MFGGGYGESGGYSQGMGGGFTGGGFSSPGGGGDKTKKFKTQNIAPLTTAHIRALSNDGNAFHLGDTEVGQVTIVGIVTHVDKSQTSITYKVDDTTSVPITLKHWYVMDASEEGGEEEGAIYNEGTYVRVYGQVRSFQNKVSLSALNIRPIEDMNELTTHILECIKFQMSINKKKTKKMDFGPPSGGFSDLSTSMTSNVTNMGIDKVQSQVFELIKSCDEPQGLGISEMNVQLRGLTAAEIKNSVDFLSNEGHIYSTFDEEHFKATG